MFSLRRTLSRFRRGGESRPLEVYVQPLGNKAKPEGVTANPLILKGLFIS